MEAKILGDKLVKIKNGESNLNINCEQDKWMINLSAGDIEQKYTLLKNKTKLSNAGQLFGELLWYGKVLYTNGEAWKYLEVTKCSKDGIINDIVDLRKILYGTCVKFQEPLENWYERISKMQEKGLEIEINCETKSDTEDLMSWIEKKVNFEEKRMNIDITAEEYFEQLLLMERQYDQEEDLYPWIYMLLQMKECQRKIVDKSYKGVSIRYIAGGSKADSVIGRNQISAFGVFPDIAILDKDFFTISTKGGIERKQLEELKDKINGIDEYLKHSRRKGAKKINIPDSEINNKIRQFCLNNNMNKIYGCIEAKPIAAELKDLNEDLGSYTYESIIGSNGLNTIGELIFELIWYGKVIYTNGLVWKYFELNENNNIHEIRNKLFEINQYIGDKKKKYDKMYQYIKENNLCVKCTEIANLTNVYTAYKNSSKQLTSEQKKVWKNLINELVKIQWLPQTKKTKED